MSAIGSVSPPEPISGVELHLPQAGEQIVRQVYLVDEIGGPAEIWAYIDCSAVPNGNTHLYVDFDYGPVQGPEDWHRVDTLTQTVGNGGEVVLLGPFATSDSFRIMIDAAQPTSFGVPFKILAKRW